jgi:nicotinamide mononucleotide adenylyltransferase
MPRSVRSAYALALGRFQPVHMQHLEYLLATAQRGKHLIVGITNPSRRAPIPSPTAPHRAEPEANPFSYFDRYRMIRATLLREGMRANTFTIVPAALGSPALLDTLPSPEHMVCYTTINDAWGKEKRRIVEEAGIRVEVLWERTDPCGLITGTMIRHRIRSGERWDAFVPEAAASVLREVLRDGQAPQL